MVFKILNNFTFLNPGDFFQKRSTSYKLRGHTEILKTERSTNKVVDGFFINRIKAAWNKLPQSVVSSNSVEAFKKNLNEVDLIDLNHNDFVFKTS